MPKLSNVGPTISPYPEPSHTVLNYRSSTSLTLSKYEPSPTWTFVGFQTPVFYPVNQCVLCYKFVHTQESPPHPLPSLNTQDFSEVIQILNQFFNLTRISCVLKLADLCIFLDI